MEQIAFIDLDGLVARNDRRFHAADYTRARFLEDRIAEARQTGTFAWEEWGKQATDLYWNTAFSPELVALDTLVDGALEGLDHLVNGRGYQLIYLTSRPQSMRQATIAWLAEQGIQIGPGHALLVMREQVFSDARVFTKVWKAGIILTLTSMYGVLDVVVIDDTAANLAELEKYRAQFHRLTTARTFDEALAKLHGEYQEEGLS
jgi:hypothetical protein